MEAFSVLCEREICGREACLLQLPETGRASLASVTDDMKLIQGRSSLDFYTVYHRC